MTTDVAAQVADLVHQAARAVDNAKMRSRLRGENVELVIAGARLAEATELLRGEEPSAAI